MSKVRLFHNSPIASGFSTRYWVIACCMLVSVISTNVAADNYSDGLHAYLDGDYATAQSHWLKGAKAKNAKSMFNLGLLHERQQIDGASEDKALSWFRLAGNNGYAAADYHLALYLAANGGLASEIDALLEKASQKGYGPAMRKLYKGTNSKVSQVAAIQKDSGYQTEGWLKRRRAESWTIQMLAFNDETKVRTFIDTHGLKRKAAYYSEQANGETLYKLVYGVYDSKDQADFARQNLSNELRQHGPWLRTIASVQIAIKAQ